MFAHLQNIFCLIQNQYSANDVESYVVVQINELIGLILNTTFKFHLPEMFSRPTNRILSLSYRL